jgi:hypothetical protein
MPLLNYLQKIISGNVIRWKAKYFMTDFAISSEICQSAVSGNRLYLCFKICFTFLSEGSSLGSHLWWKRQQVSSVNCATTIETLSLQESWLLAGTRGRAVRYVLYFKIMVSSNVVPCSLVGDYQCFTVCCVELVDWLHYIERCSLLKLAFYIIQ